MRETASPLMIVDAPADLGVVIEGQFLRSLRSALPQSQNVGFALSANDPCGVLVGGLVASMSYGWLIAKCLWVADERRGEGLGKTLMARAEVPAAPKSNDSFH